MHPQSLSRNACPASSSGSSRGMCCKNNLETELGRQFILGVITQPSIRGSRLRTEPAQLRPLSATTVLAPSGSYAGPHNPESFAKPPHRIGILIVDPKGRGSRERFPQ